MDIDKVILISVVVPVYNEEENIRPFLERAIPILEKIGSYEIIFCVDPSTDSTEEIIRTEAEHNPSVGLLTFSRRFGQPSATIAGILNCRGESCAVIDVDLQDPPELLLSMYEKLGEGYDVVYAKRRSRIGETWLKLLVSHCGYLLIDISSNVKIPRNTGDFRIMTRRLVEELRLLPEKHGFLRGLVAFIGYSHGEIEYDRDSRSMGVSKYNRFFGSLKIGLNGLIGFSTAPLSLVTWVGFSIAMLASIGALVMIFNKLVLNYSYPMGIPTIIVLVLFMGGVQLISVGILGEYIGRIYEEVRNRPMFIVDKALNVDVRTRDGRQPTVFKQNKME